MQNEMDPAVGVEHTRFYSLPALPFEYNDLEPIISQAQLSIHYEKHHKSYVDNANIILEALDEARKDKKELDYKSVLKSLSFYVGGHVLHSLFWSNLTLPHEEKIIPSKIKESIENEFGSIDRFMEEFSSAAFSVEGSGWATLAYSKLTKRPMIMQIEKHNMNIYPSCKILLVLDVWEHAYYLDYKNDRKKFIDSFWDLVNWEEVNKRFIEL
jgi:Fe-Mn family superoxide dismutase